MAESDSYKTVYRGRGGKCYHLEDCGMLTRYEPEQQKHHRKTTIDKAKAMGLKPCMICEPPRR